jgi:hypothetical protein
MWEKEQCGELVTVVNWPVVEDTDEARYCFESLCYATVGGRGEEVPRRGEDDLADDVGREPVTWNC